MRLIRYGGLDLDLHLAILTPDHVRERGDLTQCSRCSRGLIWPGFELYSCCHRGYQASSPSVSHW